MRRGREIRGARRTLSEEARGWVVPRIPPAEFPRISCPVTGQGHVGAPESRGLKEGGVPCDVSLVGAAPAPPPPSPPSQRLTFLLPWVLGSFFQKPWRRSVCSRQLTSAPCFSPARPRNQTCPLPARAPSRNTQMPQRAPLCSPLLPSITKASSGIPCPTLAASHILGPQALRKDVTFPAGLSSGGASGLSTQKIDQPLLTSLVQAAAIQTCTDPACRAPVEPHQPLPGGRAGREAAGRGCGWRKGDRDAPASICFSLIPTRLLPQGADPSLGWTPYTLPFAHPLESQLQAADIRASRSSILDWTTLNTSRHQQIHTAQSNISARTPRGQGHSQPETTLTLSKRMTVAQCRLLCPGAVYTPAGHLLCARPPTIPAPQRLIHTGAKQGRRGWALVLAALQTLGAYTGWGIKQTSEQPALPRSDTKGDFLPKGIEGTSRGCLFQRHSYVSRPTGSIKRWNLISFL